ncbi:cytochrome c oxidase assembly factor 7A-like [Diadema setosum]|uniref:cytochrome c oxidase assembly factor 7A-like n=1 Tax=Diadema setosum TaxID=31175 RepID=UPI003B3BA34B
MFSVDFKSEEEVKEYIKNVGTEYSFQCYKEKTPDGCFRLGDFFAAVKNDFPQAAKAYQKSCDDFSHARGCSKIGAFYLYGKGVDRDREKALHYFTKGCEEGNTDACFGAGSVLLSSKKGTNEAEEAQNRSRGLGYLEGACKQDHAASCFNLSAIFIKGLSGVEKDMARAAHYSVRSCELGHMYGCVNASRMYAIGDGIAKDESLAAKFKEKAKELHTEAKETNRQLKFGET